VLDCLSLSMILWLYHYWNVVQWVNSTASVMLYTNTFRHPPFQLPSADAQRDP
jgi:hypothetical protein